MGTSGEQGPNEEHLLALESQVADLADRVAKLEHRLKGGGGLDRGSGTGPVRKLSIREYLTQCAAKSQPQKAVAICGYLEANEDLDAFNAKDLKEGYRRAKEKLPPNINATLDKCVMHGWLRQLPEKKHGHKAWGLTETGARRLREGFSKE